MSHDPIDPPAVRAAYERDGYVILRNVLDPDLVREADDFVDWLLRKHPERRPEQLHSDVMRDEPFMLRLVSDERLLDIAEIFLGPHIALSDAHYICKPPGDVSIHHPKILHGSNANTSAHWRRGLTIRCMPTSTRVTKPNTSSQFLLRGAAVPGINQYLPRPRFRPGEHMSCQGQEAWL